MSTTDLPPADDDAPTVREHALRVGAGNAPLRTVLVLAQVHESCDFCHAEDVAGDLEQLPVPALACAAHYAVAAELIQGVVPAAVERDEPEGPRLILP